MIREVISILDFVFKKYDSVKKKIKEFLIRKKTRKIRKAIDDGDTDYIKRVVSDIIEQRRKRQDSA